MPGNQAQHEAEQPQAPNDLQSMLRSGWLAVSAGPGPEVVLRDVRSEATWVAGGPLVEAGSADARPQLAGLRFQPIDETGPSTSVAQPFSDALGAGVLLERRFAVAGLPLNARCTLRLYDEAVSTDGLALLRLDLRLEHPGAPGGEPLRVERVFPFVTGSWWRGGSLSLCGQSRDFAAYKNGWQSWSYAGGLPQGKSDPRPRVPALAVWHSPGGRRPHGIDGRSADVVSEEVALLGRRDLEVALLAGFLNADTWLGQISLDRATGSLAACALTDGWLLQPGGTLILPPLLLALGSPHELLPVYASAVGKIAPARRSAPSPTGWCSWYYYFARVSEADIVENLAALQAARPQLPLAVAQIDDGYQTTVGDWTSINARFPSGMASLARRIRAAGYRSGLWLAPFTATANSRLAREHPDWLIRDASGKPVSAGPNWSSVIYGLDISHPEVRAWLRALFETIVREWGYDYLKLDFLASAALSGVHHDPTMTRAQALRDGLALIRETVGDSVFLLGCGCPLLGAVGLVDAMRIGPDSAPYWSPRHKGLPLPLSEGHTRPALVGAVRNTLARAWMDPALWINDPDCLLVRQDDSELTLDEVRAFATAVGLTGGMVILSDRVARLPLDRLQLVARLLPPLDVRARPLDPFAWGIPEQVAARVERPWGTWTLVGLFNGEGRRRTLGVSWRELRLAPGLYHAVEFWSGTYLGQSDEGIRLSLAPHGAAALRITPVLDGPQLLGTTFHIGQGTVEVVDWRFDASRRTLEWHVRLGREDAGEILISPPSWWQIERLTSTARAFSWRSGALGELVVSAEIDDHAAFTAQLAGE